MFNTNWDVDKYKNEFESSEHWELRRQFMVAHKQKYPELQLVCLTQVFFNMEFLGCRYPQKTMDLVNKLAGEVAEDFRESRKGKLKRTFVGAQDAAGAKAKGAKPPSGAVEGSDVKDGPPEQKPRLEEKEIPCIEIKEEEGPSDVKTELDPYYEIKDEIPVFEVKDDEDSDCIMTEDNDDDDEEKYAEALKECAKYLVLLIPIRANSKTEKDPMKIVHQIFNRDQIRWSLDGSKAAGGWTCKLYVDPYCDNEPKNTYIQKGRRNKIKPQLLIASSFASSQRDGKYQTAHKAIKYLKKYCTVIEPNPEWFKEGKTPEFIQKRIPCNKNPRTYLIMKKEDTGHISPEVADLLLANFERSSNQDMFFPDTEYTEKEKIQLMNRCNKLRLGFRHFGTKDMLKHHHVCIYKQKTANDIIEEANQMGGKHPKYIIHYNK